MFKKLMNVFEIDKPKPAVRPPARRAEDGPIVCCAVIIPDDVIFVATSHCGRHLRTTFDLLDQPGRREALKARGKLAIRDGDLIYRLQVTDAGFFTFLVVVRATDAMPLALADGFNQLVMDLFFERYAGPTEEPRGEAGRKWKKFVREVAKFDSRAIPKFRAALQALRDTADPGELCREVALQNRVTEVEEAMKKALQTALDKSEKLETLEAKAEDLAATAEVFKKKAELLKWKMMGLKAHGYQAALVSAVAVGGGGAITYGLYEAGFLKGAKDEVTPEVKSLAASEAKQLEMGVIEDGEELLEGEEGGAGEGQGDEEYDEWEGEEGEGEGGDGDGDAGGE